jgi:predicted MFS family arabinose efflux permease
MWTLLNLSVGTTGLFAHKVEGRLGQKRSMVLVVVLISAGYFLAGRFISLGAIAVLFFFYAVRGIATPVLKDYINRYCASEIRATILSLRNFIIRINFAVLGPLLGWVVDRHSLQTAFWVAGGAYLIGGVGSILATLSRKREPLGTLKKA